jgi:hypothetical protein
MEYKAMVKATKEYEIAISKIKEAVSNRRPQEEINSLVCEAQSLVPNLDSTLSAFHKANYIIQRGKKIISC